MEKAIINGKPVIIREVDEFLRDCDDYEESMLLKMNCKEKSKKENPEVDLNGLNFKKNRGKRLIKDYDLIAKKILKDYEKTFFVATDFFKIAGYSQSSNTYDFSNKYIHNLRGSLVKLGYDVECIRHPENYKAKAYIITIL